MANVTKSLAISLAESYIIIILQLGTFVLIARFLTPNEIGLYSVSVAVTGIVHLLRDFGVGSYLIQEKEITNERIRTAFTITLMISIFFFALFQ
ncbi:MAG: oligosaccharide flippase family protein, partial [Candidatus Competibacteraceae bacterium]|nr:oligosaccharide flippase family protein [Candidatus Competibacteraceae bacterium]